MGKEKRKSSKKKRSRSRSPSSSPDSDRRRHRSRSPKRDRKDKKKERSKSKKHKRSRSRSSSRDRAKQTRKLAQKQLKKLARDELREKEAELYGYDDASNPFGDQNLSKPFLWKKKIEREIVAGKPAILLSKEELKRKQSELKREIEQVKERRLQRQIEKEQMEELKEQMQRENDMEMIEGWEAKEEEFHAQQAQLRSIIRITEGREKPIDILAKNIHVLHGLQGQQQTLDNKNMAVDLDVELTEPHRIFDGLSVADLEELDEEIKQHIQVGAESEYWRSLSVVCVDELMKARGVAAGREIKMPGNVRQAVETMMEGKNVEELDRLQRDIAKKIDGQDDSGEAVDVPFWEALQKVAVVYRARAYLRHFHADLLAKRLKQLKEQQMRERKRQTYADSDQEEDDFDFRSLAEDENKKSSETKESEAYSEDEEGSFSPLLHADDDDEEDAVDPEEDRRQLEAQRRVVLEQKAMEVAGAIPSSSSSSSSSRDRDSHAAVMAAAGMNRFQLTDEQMYERERSREVEDDEVQFSVEENLPDHPYWWHDKYRPRKPRYFNRVKTGFEWNKYNQTHYDKENPPPKIVQGYKFNMFYPDLIDSSKAPTFRLERCAEPDFCIIRFTAGPPYEDVAFKIVKKEWEYSHKRGYKCSFDRGVLQLHFNFKRYFYRR